MATNNVNSNYFSVAAYTNKGLSGMVSGMDTEGMVKQMMAATQKKIDTQLAAKQRTQWRQSYYRDIISSINTLRNKYFNTAFDASPLNNFASARFFNSKVSSVSGNNAVRVISTSHNAPIGDVKISVGQLATSTALASDKAVGNLGSIKGTVFTQDMADAFDKALVLSVSGTQGQIRVDLNGVSTQDAMLDRINNALEGTGATAKLYGGKLRFVTDSSTRSVIVNARSTDLALKMTGLVAGDRTALLETGEPGQMLEGSMMINPSAGVTLTVNLDGVTKQITINPTTLYDPNYMATNPAYDPERDPAHPLYNPSHPAFNPVNIPGSGLYDPDDPEYNPIYDPDSEQFIPFKEAWDPDDLRNFKITAEAIAASLNAELDRAFGDYVDAEINGEGKLVLSLNFGSEGGHSLSIFGSDATRLGLDIGASTRLTTASKLSELGDDALGLIGDRYSFTINGKDFTFSKDDTIGTMINRINSANAGVQMSYSSLSNKFTLTATSTGEKYDIDITQSEGNLLSVIFQKGTEISPGVMSYTSMFEAGKYVSSGYLTVDSIKGKSLSPLDLQAKFDKSAQFRINVNGQDYICPLPSNREYTTVEAINMVNAWLEEEFGSDGGVQNIYFNISAGVLEVNGDFTVKFAQTAFDAENASAYAAGVKQDIALAMGLNNVAKSNIANGQTKIGDVYQLGELIDALRDTMPALIPALTDIEDKQLSELDLDFGYGKVSFSGGRLSVEFTAPVTLTGGGNGGLDDIVAGLFGKKLDVGETFDIITGSGAMTGSYVSQGLDAIVTINDVTTTRSSNLFEFDGLTIELLKKTEPGDDPTIISTQRDTESIMDAFKSFVEDYNAMIKMINDLVYADPTYRQYAPLTDEQKKEMSDREIDLWEEQAKGGLLRNDDILLPFLNSLYGTLYTRPLSSSFALYDIGIESPDYKNPGILTLDENKLRRALADDPGAVEALFTDSINGISVSMSNLMDRVARISISNPGSLVTLAGATGSYTDKNNVLHSELERINDRLKDLQDRYERERARYWRQFNLMEQVMSNYSAQSAYIAQMFMDMGGGY